MEEATEEQRGKGGKQKRCMVERNGKPGNLLSPNFPSAHREPVLCNTINTSVAMLDDQQCVSEFQKSVVVCFVLGLNKYISKWWNATPQQVMKLMITGTNKGWVKDWQKAQH